MKKLIPILFVGSIAAAFVIVFGGRKLFKMGTEKASSFMKGKMEQAAAQQATAPVPETPPAPEEPTGLKIARAVLSEDPEERKTAIAALSALPNPELEAAALLSTSLATSSAAIKPDILAGLAALAPKNPQTVEAITGALKDRRLRLQAVNTLGNLGPAAASAVPALKKISTNLKEKKSTRTAAKAALAKIQPPIKKAAKRRTAGRKGKKKI